MVQQMQEKLYQTGDEGDTPSRPDFITVYAHLKYSSIFKT